MIIMAIHMIFKIRAQKRAIAPQHPSANADRSVGRDNRIQNQMFILMLSSICIFLITTLPLTIDHIVSSYTITSIAGLEQMIGRTTILTWIQTLNCAVSFFLVNMYDIVSILS